MGQPCSEKRRLPLALCAALVDVNKNAAITACMLVLDTVQDTQLGAVQAQHLASASGALVALQHDVHLHQRPQRGLYRAQQ